MLQPNRESLEVTINKIKKNEILLPDFQRQFVWKEEEMQHKLVASVLTKMPIGSILLLKSKDAHDYSCKPLGAKDPIPSEQLPSGAVEFLLDGQQRMTVLANVFSDAIFQLTPQSNNLIAPSALKRRFYLAVPKYGNDAFPDLFGLHSLSFPMRTPDSDEPEFLTQDILPFIRVVPFNVKRDNGKCYNPYSRPIPRMLSELETYCPSVEDGWSYIPLYLLVENETISLNHTTLNNIIVSIAKSVSTAKQLTLNEMIYYMDPENFLKRIGGRYLRGVIDYEHAQCNLDTPEFREILQSALKAGSYDGGYNPDKNVPQRIVDGELICCYVGLSSALEVSFDRYRCGQTLGYVGWPTPDGSNGMDVRLMMPLGVSATTSCPEGCWEFLKYLLLHPWMEYSADGTPVYAPLLQDNLDVLKNIEVPYAEITTFDDVQLIVDLAKTCETMDFYDEEAMSILLEEMGDLVSGNIDLDTAVERMQSRLNLYLMEQVK